MLCWWPKISVYPPPWDVGRAEMPHSNLSETQPDHECLQSVYTNTLIKSHYLLQCVGIQRWENRGLLQTLFIRCVMLPHGVQYMFSCSDVGYYSRKVLVLEQKYDIPEHTPLGNIKLQVVSISAAVTHLHCAILDTLQNKGPSWTLHYNWVCTGANHMACSTHDRI